MSGHDHQHDHNESHQHDYNLSFRQHIDQYGLSVVQIEATDYLPGFAYSIGLWEKYGHPEIICFGLTQETLHTVINDAADLVKAGEPIQTGVDYTEIFRQSDAQFIGVDPDWLPDYFGYAINFYGSSDFPALQLVWTDRNNLFPWQEDFEKEFVIRQPLLDRNMDFKFREEPTLGIFTTRQWLEQKKPILRMVHDADGDWQFLTGDQTTADARIADLGEMVRSDPGLNDLFNLDYGEAASREFPGGSWQRELLEEDETEEDETEEQEGGQEEA